MNPAPPTHALTLKPPWPAAILYATKRVENRSWAPNRLPVRIALHAGRTADPAGRDRLEPYLGAALPQAAYDRGIVGLATIASVHTSHGCLGRPDCLLWGNDTGWHWMLDEVRVLEDPVPVTGALGLWKLPADVTGKLGPSRPVPGRGATPPAR